MLGIAFSKPFWSYLPSCIQFYYYYYKQTKRDEKQGGEGGDTAFFFLIKAYKYSQTSPKLDFLTASPAGPSLCVQPHWWPRLWLTRADLADHRPSTLQREPTECYRILPKSYLGLKQQRNSNTTSLISRLPPTLLVLQWCIRSQDKNLRPDLNSHFSDKTPINFNGNFVCLGTNGAFALQLFTCWK